MDDERSILNRTLLENMDSRPDRQLQLQKTVERLSVVTICYHAVLLINYPIFPRATALNVSKAILTVALTLPAVLIV